MLASQSPGRTKQNVVTAQERARTHDGDPATINRACETSQSPRAVCMTTSRHRFKSRDCSLSTPAAQHTHTTAERMQLHTRLVGHRVLHTPHWSGRGCRTCRHLRKYRRTILKLGLGQEHAYSKSLIPRGFLTHVSLEQVRLRNTVVTGAYSSATRGRAWRFGNPTLATRDN